LLSLPNAADEILFCKPGLKPKSGSSKIVLLIILLGDEENLFSQTIAALEKFDNQHDFERMSADILNASGYKDVVLIAPRGGSDGGKDITFTTQAGKTGLACVTLRKDIDRKFEEDFSQRKTGEFDIYMLFCTAYLTASQKSKYTHFCRTILHAQFVPKDIETLRSILDSSIQSVRDKYLHGISSPDVLPNNAEVIVDAIMEKLGRLPQANGLNEKMIMDWLIEETQMLNGKVSVDLGDVPGVKHSMRMTKANEDWEAWYGMWFQQAFTERMGFEPKQKSIHYALEKYAEIAE
jgi:hypothetical protein